MGWHSRCKFFFFLSTHVFVFSFVHLSIIHFYLFFHSFIHSSVSLSSCQSCNFCCSCCSCSHSFKGRSDMGTRTWQCIDEEVWKSFLCVSVFRLGISLSGIVFWKSYYYSLRLWS